MLDNQYSDEEISIANATCRDSGAVGKNAIVPRFVADMAEPGDSILDFGAGPKAIHATALRNKGFSVDSIDFGSNLNPEVHNLKCFEIKYDIVFASNVLNVQSNLKMLKKTLLNISEMCADRFVFNYPPSPRKSAITTAELLCEVRNHFDSIERLGKNAYVATKVKES